MNYARMVLVSQRVLLEGGGFGGQRLRENTSEAWWEDLSAPGH